MNFVSKIDCVAHHRVININNAEKIMTIDLNDQLKSEIYYVIDTHISDIILNSFRLVSHKTFKFESSRKCRNSSTAIRFHSLNSFDNSCLLRMWFTLTRVLITSRLERFILRRIILKHVSWFALRDAKYTTMTISALIHDHNMTENYWEVNYAWLR